MYDAAGKLLSWSRQAALVTAKISEDREYLPQFEGSSPKSSADEYASKITVDLVPIV